MLTMQKPAASLHQDKSAEIDSEIDESMFVAATDEHIRIVQQQMHDLYVRAAAIAKEAGKENDPDAIDNIMDLIGGGPRMPQ